MLASSAERQRFLITTACEITTLAFQLAVLGMWFSAQLSGA